MQSALLNLSTLPLQPLLQASQADPTDHLDARRAAKRQYHPFGRLRVWLVVESLAEPGCAIFRLQDNLPLAPVEFALAPQIHGNNAVVLAKIVELWLKVAVIAGNPVKKDQGRRAPPLHRPILPHDDSDIA